MILRSLGIAHERTGAVRYWAPEIVPEREALEASERRRAYSIMLGSLSCSGRPWTAEVGMRRS